MCLLPETSPTLLYLIQSSEFRAFNLGLLLQHSRHITLRRISRCNNGVFNLEGLADLTSVHEYAVMVSDYFNVLSTHENPVRTVVYLQQ